MQVNHGKINRGGLWVYGSNLLFSTLFYGERLSESFVLVRALLRTIRHVFLKNPFRIQ